MLSFLFACADPPPPPPPPKLSLSVEPADAVLTVDGEVVDAPWTGTVNQAALVTVKRKGFADLDTTVVAPEPGQVKTEVLTLKPLEMALKVTSEPAGAVVSIDGEEVGRTPLNDVVLAGKRAIAVSMDGYNTETTEKFVHEAVRIDAWMDLEGQVLDLVRIFPTGHLPKGLAITADNSQVWVASLGGYGVNIHDLQTGKELKDLKLPDAGSVEIIFADDDQVAYATQMETARVFELDVATQSIKQTWNTKSNFTKVPILSADGSKLYASNWKGHDVTELDRKTGKVLRSLRGGSTPRGLYASPDGKFLYVASYTGAGLNRIDLATGKREKLARGRALRHIVPSPDDTKLYVSDMAAHAIMVYDVAANTFTKLADTMKHPNTIDLSPDGKVLYVSNRGRNGPGGYLTVGNQRGSVLAIDTATGDILDAVAGGMQCTALDVSPDGSLLVFSDFRDDALRVYRIPPYEQLRAGNGGRWKHHEQDVLDLSYRKSP